MNRRRGQKGVTGLRVFDALNGFTGDQAEDGHDKRVYARRITSS